jgi:hypothetical protein
MSVASRPVSTGKTRTCPHCKATILESLSICPGCMHHLRFDSEAAKRQVAAAPALRVEGIIRHPPLEEPLEYFVIIAIRNDRGEEVTRQVVNVGALQAAEKRTFTLSVEVLPPQAAVQTKSNAATGTFKSPIPQPTATVRPSTPAPSSTAASAQPASGSAPLGAAANAAGSPSGTATGAGGGAKPSTPTMPPRPSTMGASPTLPGQPRPGATPGGPTGSAPKAPAPGSANPPTPGNPPNAANPANPASPAKPTSGYVLKPPSPGGPKRH